MAGSYFTQVAEEWDNLRQAMFSEAVRAAALSRVALPPESVVADIGAGTGFISQGLAPIVQTVHLVDNSAEMLSVARRNLSGYANVEYHTSDGKHIPLPDGSLDAAFANMFLHHAPDPLSAVQEMARILKPGGRLVITDLDLHNYAWLRAEQDDVWLGFDRADIRRWFQSAGLVDVLVEDTQETCSTQSASGSEQATVSIFVATGTRPMPGSQSAVNARYREIAQSGSSCCSSPSSISLSDESIPLDVVQSSQSCGCGPQSQETISAEEIQPSDEADFSLGCGNPVALASLQPGEVVLDIGSGAGADMFPAARRVGPQGKVIGLDMLEEMLARARARAEKYGYTNVEFRQGDAVAMPIEDGTVDVVMSNCVLNLVTDKGRAFQEIYRVLKPGGRLAVSDIVTDRPFSPAMREKADSWAACVTGALSEREYLALISQAGFKEISTSRSQSMPAEDGTLVYSLTISAKKLA